MIAKAGRTFPTEETIRRYTAHLRSVARERGGEAAIAGGALARARVATLKGDRMLFELEREQGRWLSLAEAEATMVLIVKHLRDGVLQIPATMDWLDRATRAKVDGAIRDALTAMADEVEAGGLSKSAEP